MAQAKPEVPAEPNSTEWAQDVLNQLVEAQKAWFEITTKQNALLLETVTKVSQMRENAPTEALSDWAKQGIESFVEAQKSWSAIAGQQTEQILKAVQNNRNLSDSNRESISNSAQKNQEALAKMHSAWLDYAGQQNAQMMKVMKESLKIDDSSPAAALADFAQEAVTNYIDVQKRWLNLALQLPFAGSDSKK